MRAASRCSHADDLVNARGLGTLPRRVSFGRAALPGLGGRVLRGALPWSFAAFELASMQSVQLSFKLLILLFQLDDAVFGRCELLAALLQLVFIVILQETGIEVALPDRLRGQPIQIRTSM